MSKPRAPIFKPTLYEEDSLMMLLRITDCMFAFCGDDSFLLRFLSPGLSDAVEEGVFFHVHASALTCCTNKDYTRLWRWNGQSVVPWCYWPQLGNQQRQHAEVVSFILIAWHKKPKTGNFSPGLYLKQLWCYCEISFCFWRAHSSLLIHQISTEESLVVSDPKWTDSSLQNTLSPLFFYVTLI